MSNIKPIGSNQTERRIGPYITILYSYSTPVAALIHSKVIRTNAKHSATTTKHVNKWAGSEARKLSQAFFDGLAADSNPRGERESAYVMIDACLRNEKLTECTPYMAGVAMRLASDLSVLEHRTVVVALLNAIE